jgi:hypothetical protein
MVIRYVLNLKSELFSRKSKLLMYNTLAYVSETWVLSKADKAHWVYLEAVFSDAFL